MPSMPPRYRVVLFLVMILSCLVTTTARGTDGTSPLTRFPDLSPDGGRIAFAHMGDLWVVPSGGGEARRLTDHEAYDHSPHWSPDGTEIAFSSNRHGNDDVFVVAAAGGRAKRMTWHSAGDQVVDWDRSGILFTSRRESRSGGLFRTRTDGTLPERLFNDRILEAEVSPDGTMLAYVRGWTPWWRKHYRGKASRDIWLRRIDGGKSVRLTDWEGDDDDPMWADEGRSIYYVSEGEDSTANLWKLSLEPGGETPRVTGRPEKITAHEGASIEHLSKAADGSLLSYERAGRIWTLSPLRGEPRMIDIVLRSDDKWNRVRDLDSTNGATEFALSSDGTEIAFALRGEIFVMGLEEGLGTDKIRRVTKSAARERDLAWAPDGEALYFAADRDGDIDLFRISSTDEEEKRLSRSRKTETVKIVESEENDFQPLLSPEGDRILFLRGSRYLWIAGSDGSNARRLIPDNDVIRARWSADGRWIAISRSNLGAKEDVILVDAANSEQFNVTGSPRDDFTPEFVDGGKRLAFATRDDYGNLWMRYAWLTKEEWLKTDDEREAEEDGAEEEKKDDEEDEESDEKIPDIEIDFDEMFARLVTVTRVAGSYNPWAVSPDGSVYAFQSNQLGSSDLWIVNDGGDHLERVGRGDNPTNMVFTGDGKALYYLAGGGRIKRVAIDEGAKADGAPAAVSFRARFDVDLEKEAAQKFHEAWTLLADGFYDDRFHGVDWRKLREEYEPRALAAYTVEDFSDVLSELIGELSASHLGVYPPGAGGDATAEPGFLIDPSHTGPGVRVAYVLPDGPADRETSRIGPNEYILAVDGEPVDGGVPYYELWNHKAGGEVDLVVAEDGDGKNRREGTIRPTGGRRLARLLYEDWVRTNRSMVEKLSAGRLGYVHMAAMGGGDITRLQRELWAVAGDKGGLVLDVRFNNGGSIHDQVITILRRRPYALERRRGREENYNPHEMWERPVACLINERSYSDGEIFPWAFKEMELGPLVGTNTFGAVIGTQDVPLVDGTYFRIPGSGWYGLDGTNMENQGVAPDVPIDEVPEERTRGRDAQLEKAVEVLLESLGG